MADPTIGALVVSLLMAGGKLIADGALKQIGKDSAASAFAALKARLTKDNGVTTLNLVDQAAETPAFKDAIAADIDKSTAPQDEATLALVEQLRAAIDALPQEQTAYAIDGGTFKAGRDLIARNVEGIRNAKMTATRDMDLSGAKSPGKC